MEEGTMNAYSSGKGSYQSCIPHTSLHSHVNKSTILKFITSYHLLTPRQHSLTFLSDRPHLVFNNTDVSKVRSVFETSVTIYQGTRCNYTEGWNFRDWGRKCDSTHSSRNLYESPQTRKYSTTLALHTLIIAPDKLGKIRGRRNCSAEFRTDAILSSCLAGPPCHQFHILHRLVLGDPAKEIGLFIRKNMCHVTI